MKKLPRKSLTLRRETIRELDHLRHIGGGAIDTWTNPETYNGCPVYTDNCPVYTHNPRMVTCALG
jgi:hypothetical protein